MLGKSVFGSVKPAEKEIEYFEVEKSGGKSGRTGHEVNPKGQAQGCIRLGKNQNHRIPFRSTKGRFWISIRAEGLGGVLTRIVPDLKYLVAHQGLVVQKVYILFDLF